MTVKELIEKLSQFDPNWKVSITDGYQAISYEGDFLVEEFEGSVDIGIGGLNITKPY